MNAKTMKPEADELARSALLRAAGPDEPDVGRLIEALPEILAEAHRRRAAQTGFEPVVSILVSLARTAIPRLAAATAMLVLAASFFGFRDTPRESDSQTGLDEYILTGEVGDAVSDLLLEAIAEEGTTMADLNKGPTRRTAAMLLGVVFVLGAVCGAALVYLGQRSVLPVRRPAGGPPDHPLARMSRELDLDPEQRVVIREILDEQRAQLGEFLEGSREKIRAVLRPEQQERFDRMRPADPAHPGGPPPPDHRPLPGRGHRPPPPGGPPPGHPPPPPGHAPPPGQAVPPQDQAQPGQ